MNRFINLFCNKYSIRLVLPSCGAVRLMRPYNTMKRQKIMVCPWHYPQWEPAFWYHHDKWFVRGMISHLIQLKATYSVSHISPLSTEYLTGVWTGSNHSCWSNLTLIIPVQISEPLAFLAFRHLARWKKLSMWHLTLTPETRTRAIKWLNIYSSSSK